MTNITHASDPASPHVGGNIVIQAHAVAKSFPGIASAEPIPVIRGVSLQVRAGEMVSIVGPSGSGKSTLLYLLSGLEPCDAGSVQVMGQTLGMLSRASLAKLRRDHVGFVFQSFNLISSLSAHENVALPARLAKRSTSKAKVLQALEDVGLRAQAQQRPGQLSGGQQQRVALARVLAMNPDVVFADEPTGALDSKTGKDILRLLRLAASGTRSVVVVTHDLEAAALADRVFVLRDGLIHSELIRPTTEQVFEAFMQSERVSK